VALLTDAALADLVAAVGEAHVVTDAGRRVTYEQDWTGRFVGATPAVLRPGSTAEVAACLQACARHRLAVVPQGGNTGLVAGGVPLDGEVVLSLTRLQRLDPVDTDAAHVVAGAGVTLAALAAHARAAGLRYAVDLAARDSATVGGMVATNAGGMRVLRHGATRRQVLGVEAVLSSGAVVSHLQGLTKDNTGYDLAGLLTGSEGTLGVVTAAVLRLVPVPAHQVVALAGMPDVREAVAAVARWRALVPDLEAAELVLAAGVDLVCERHGLAPPLPGRWPAYVVVEAAGVSDPTEALAAAVGDDGAVGDVAVATDAPRRAQLWQYRELHTEAIGSLGPPHKLDVTLPQSQLAPFVEEVPALVASVAPSARTWLFGHVGDGNIHVNVTGIDPDDDTVDDAVLRDVARRGGSISAEHGIGRAKDRWLSLARTPAELDAFAAIKRALDPAGILNPGVLLAHP
jgi:FAD/FMN-containing dehydrogenase